MIAQYGDCLVFVHVGAGVYSRKPDIIRLYKASAKRACKRALECMGDGGCARKAAVIACCTLEDDPIINAGPDSPANTHNSDITTRECDAAIMSSDLQRGAAVGCLAGFKNPIAAADSLLSASTIQNTDDTSRPLLLVGDGAASFSHKQGLQDLSSSHKLVCNTVKASNGVTDTVGVICIDKNGNVAVASSSAGVPGKHRGRIGPAALIGSGLWVKTFSRGQKIAVCCSGMGEDIISLCMASQIASLISSTREQQAQEAINCYLQDAISDFDGKEFDELMVGCISIVTTTDFDTGDLIVELTIAHTTESMAAALQTSDDKTAKFILSTGGTGKISLCGLRRTLQRRQHIP